MYFILHTLEYHLKVPDEGRHAEKKDFPEIIGGDTVL